MHHESLNFSTSDRLALLGHTQISHTLRPNPTMGKYSDDPEWADVTPFPQDDGGPNPLAPIAYTPGYAEAMSYLRAIMAANEHSPRALSLTADIIDKNAAHYTVWLYRSSILSALSSDLRVELAWLDEIALSHQKNYQVWHHRQFLLDKIGDPDGEVRFVNAMFEQDAKNYHVWSYRQWLVRRFGLWEGENCVNDEGERRSELDETERMIVADVRNNSAWNHRFFLVNGREDVPGVKEEGVRTREVDFAKRAIEKAPQNQSPWNYLRGTVERAGTGLDGLRAFCEEYADPKHEERIRSSHALDLLAEIYGAEKEKEKARHAYDLLALKFDPIRSNYWNYLKGRLGDDTPVAASAA